MLIITHHTFLLKRVIHYFLIVECFDIYVEGNGYLNRKFQILTTKVKINFIYH